VGSDDERHREVRRSETGVRRNEAESERESERSAERVEWRRGGRAKRERSRLETKEEQQRQQTKSEDREGGVAAADVAVVETLSFSIRSFTELISTLVMCI